MEINKEFRGLLKGENIRNYIEGGHATITLESPSGRHYTYAFNKPVNPSAKYRTTPDFRFVKVHFDGDWIYIGTYRNNGVSQFNATKTGLLPEWHEAVKGAYYIIKMCNNPDLDTPMSLYHEGVCCRCGRKLTDPKYIKLGIGPKCAKM